MITLGDVGSVLQGIGAGSLVAVLALVLPGGRRRLGWLPALGAVVLALAVDRRLAHPWRPGGLSTAAALATAATAVWVAARVPAMARAAGLPALGAALAVSLGGVFLAVPENDQVLLVAGALAGVLLVGSVAAARVEVGVAVVGALAVSWTVAAGFVRSPLSAAGAIGCYGLLLVWPALSVRVRTARYRALVAVMHVGLVLLAARWIGAAADATWARVAVLAALLAGLATVLAAPALLAADRLRGPEGPR